MSNNDFHPARFFSPLLNRRYFPTLQPGDKVIRCDVVFGSPNANCRGLGVCKVLADLNGAELYGACKTAPGLFTKTVEGDLAVLFPKSKVCLELYKRHFRKGRLEIKHACPLPEALIGGLAFKNACLPPGIYPVDSSGEFFRVVFADINQA